MKNKPSKLYLELEPRAIFRLAFKLAKYNLTFLLIQADNGITAGKLESLKLFKKIPLNTTLIASYSILFVD